MRRSDFIVTSIDDARTGGKDKHHNLSLLLETNKIEGGFRFGTAALQCGRAIPALCRKALLGHFLAYCILGPYHLFIAVSGWMTGQEVRSRSEVNG
jgi:hypothetical protein